METVNQNKQTQSEDLSLYSLFSLFITNWITLCLSSLFFAIIALVWVVQQPNIYKAETVLMSVSNESNGLGALSGSLGGLASMAGIGLPDTGNENTKLALELIKSRAFIIEFIRKNNLLVSIMAVNDWDLDKNELIYNESIYNVESDEWLRKAKGLYSSKPSLLEAYEVFMNMLEIVQDPKTKFVTVSIEYYSPKIASDWLKKLIILLNNNIRDIDIEEANKSIEYLEQLINTSQISGLQNVFSSLMEEQIKSKMLAEVRIDYVFKVVDPAVAPEQKDKPKRSLIVIVSGFLGGIIGLIIILYRSGKKSYFNRNTK